VRGLSGDSGHGLGGPLQSDGGPRHLPDQCSGFRLEGHRQLIDSGGSMLRRLNQPLLIHRNRDAHIHEYTCDDRFGHLPRAIWGEAVDPPGKVAQGKRSSDALV
jgi:hypothetical protein